MGDLGIEDLLEVDKGTNVVLDDLWHVDPHGHVFALMVYFLLCISAQNDQFVRGVLGIITNFENGPNAVG